MRAISVDPASAFEQLTQKLSSDFKPSSRALGVMVQDSH